MRFFKYLFSKGAFIYDVSTEGGCVLRFHINLGLALNVMSVDWVYPHLVAISVISFTVGCEFTGS